jgi:hypothetical protein
MVTIEVDAEKFKALLEAVEQLGKCHAYRDEDIDRVSNVQKAIRALAPKPEFQERIWINKDYNLCSHMLPDVTEYIRADLAAIPVKGGKRGWMMRDRRGYWDGPFDNKKIFMNDAAVSYFIECEAPND